MSKRKKADAICEGCLSTNRNLSTIEAYYDMYLKIIHDPEGNNKMIDSHVPAMCFECHALLRSIARFRLKVLKANSYLSGMCRKGPKKIACLSNLDIFTNKYIDIKEEVDDNKLSIDIKIENTSLGDTKDTIFDDFHEITPPVERIFELEPIGLKNDGLEKDNEEDQEKHDSKDSLEDILNQAIKDENNSHSDANEIASSNEDVSPKVKNKSQRKKKSKSLQTKYKIVSFGDKNEMKVLYEKVKIDDKERDCWMEKEQNGRNYKTMAFKCELCISGYAKEAYYLHHIKICHSESSGDFICDICKVRKHSMSRLTYHVKQHNMKYICKLCRHECYHNWQLHNHFHYAHRRAVECLTCGLRFEQRQQFYKHYNSLHAKVVCDYCNKHFTEKRRLIRHIMLRHNLHKCVDCNKTYSTIHALTRHTNLHHVKSARELCYCVECNVQFQNVTLYTRHLKRSVKHRTNVGVPCPECNKVYHRKHAMLNHYNHVHLKKTKYYCDKCAKYFLNGFRYRQHVASIHDKIPQVKNKMCSYCDRGFSTNRILENHIRTHTGERPFACAYCTATFAQRQALVSHTRAIHKLMDFK